MAQLIQPRPMTRGRQIDLPQILAYALLTLGAVTMVVPFFWMISTSMKTVSEILKPQFFPSAPTLENYVTVMTRTLFPTWYFNSLLAATASTLSVAFFDSLVGYVFAKFEFPLKKVFFVLVLMTLMVPTEMLVIPWYIMAVGVKLQDSLLGIVFPGLVTATGVFLMRQSFFAVPDELIDAARIDGMHEFGIFTTIAWPLVKSAVAAVCIFNFLGNWNAFIWPLIVTSKRATMTLPIGLSFFSGEAGSDWHLIMTGATIATVPLLIVFLFFQRQIIKGIALTGIKA
ncbi:MAG TPA: carbohydrate ABC transporter permease [Thermoflexales bacterium]|jgi:multiple sugar transport system permease protein|nr:carbohydrate ABC transporter permease [Thermoflexales bacterium]HQX10848.1 carbohydrate ABC transporter permease [Thermoflexales bacterium]HQY24725.1 carbohydrate ABC transporter permease [Thermoflexales bacterium]HQZ54815.1 carbohydrate ABC transporter permease [Thermoflexales bacterium]HRA52562.1 carbohydrate ABC transporter permease [Thermoflexales bacterium]